MDQNPPLISKVVSAISAAIKKICLAISSEYGSLFPNSCLVTLPFISQRIYQIYQTVTIQPPFDPPNIIWNNLIISRELLNFSRILPRYLFVKQHHSILKVHVPLFFRMWETQSNKSLSSLLLFIMMKQVLRLMEPITGFIVPPIIYTHTMMFMPKEEKRQWMK